jgi:TP901 family phage tail tape measure protein
MIGKETYIIEQKLTVDNSGLITGNKEAKKSTSALDGAVGGVTSKLKGMVTPANLTGAAAAYLSYRTVQAVKDFAAYEKQLSSLNTLLKVSKNDLNSYGDGLVDIAIKTGIAKETLASGAYEALSAGVDSGELLSFMETAAKGGTVGMTDVATATDVLTSTLNGFKLESSDAAGTMDKLITIQNNGKIVLGQLSTVMGDVADISNSLGLDLDNVGAALSTITMSGTPAAQAGTRLKAMFAELSKEGTTAYDTFQKITGESFKEFITKGGNLSDALQEMQTYAKSTGKEMISLWSSIEAGQGAVGLIGENANVFTKNLKAMGESAGELEKSYSIASDNIATDWAKLTAKIDSNWKELITELQTPIRTVIEVAYKIVDFAGNIDFIENTKKIYNALGGNVVGAVSSGITRVINDFQNENSMRNQKTPNNFENEKEELQSEKSSQRSYLNDLNAKEEAKKQAAFLKQQKDAEESEKKSAEQAAADRKALLEKVLSYEADHSDKINLIDIEALSSKKEYQENLNEKLKSGLISREEYNKKLENFEEESTLKQNTNYKEALEGLKNFYTNVGEIGKANAIEKQILEIEVKITGMEGDLLDGLENPELEAFKQKQLEDLTNFNNEKLIREWEYLEEIGALRLHGEISEQEFTDRKNDFDYNQRELESLFKIEQLEDLRNFYLEQGNMQNEALEVQTTINEKKSQINSAEKKATENKMRWESWAEGYKVDVHKQSAEAVMDTYTALARGQIKDLEAFKSYCKEKIAELLLAKGQEHMAEAISWTATGFGYLASLNPAIQAMAPAAFLSAAEHAAAAALFGGASSALSSGSSSSSDDTTESVSSTDDDIATAESTASSSDDKVQIYISTEENTMAKAMVKILEKELNDEYNVSIIGYKK